MAAPARPPDRKGCETMAAPKPYQGHRSWAAWNVSLWIYNDEWQYRAVRDIAAGPGRIEGKVRQALRLLGDRTPDGARYTAMNVRLVIREMIEAA